MGLLLSLQSEANGADQAKCPNATFTVCSDKSLDKDEAPEWIERELASNMKTETQRSMCTNRWHLQTQTSGELPNLEDTKTSDENKISRRTAELAKDTLPASLVLTDVNGSKDQEGDKAVCNGSSFLTASYPEIENKKGNLFCDLLLKQQDAMAETRCCRCSPSTGYTNGFLTRGQINLPCLSRKKIFMIYICGGYQGTVQEKQKSVF